MVRRGGGENRECHRNILSGLSHRATPSSAVLRLTSNHCHPPACICPGFCPGPGSLQSVTNLRCHQGHTYLSNHYVTPFMDSELALKYICLYITQLPNIGTILVVNDTRVTKSENFPESKIFVAKTFRIK